MSDTATRLPTYFISHGGGPWPWIKDQMPWDMSTLERSLQAMPREVGVTPKAVLVISGHWEERDFTVQSSPDPPMVYDYGGFPEFTYHITYPAPGSPEVAARVAELLSGAGIPVRRGPASRLRPRHVRSPGGDVPRRRRAGRAAVAQARLRPRGPPRRRPGAGPAARRGRAHRRQRPELPQPARCSARPGRSPRASSTAGSTTPCAASPSTARRRCGSGTGPRAPACRTPRRTTSSP